MTLDSTVRRVTGSRLSQEEHCAEDGTSLLRRHRDSLETLPGLVAG
jgi:hypothetical protein